MANRIAVPDLRHGCRYETRDEYRCHVVSVLTKILRRPFRNVKPPSARVGDPLLINPVEEYGVLFR
jgi:hypothetical protein